MKRSPDVNQINDEIRSRYEKGEPSASIGRRFGLSAPTVLSRLRGMGVTIRRAGHQTTTEETARSKAIVAEAVAGGNVADIAVKYGVGKQRIYEIMQAAGIRRQVAMRAQREAKAILVGEEKVRRRNMGADVVAMRSGGRSWEDIGRIVNMSTHAVSRLYLQHAPRAQGTKPSWRQTYLQRIDPSAQAERDALVSSARRLWNEGDSAQIIGLQLGVSKNTIIGIAHRHEFPPKPSPLIRSPRRLRAASPEATVHAP